MSDITLPTVSEQMAIAGQASRAREARDNKVFVNSLFKEIDQLKSDNAEMKALLAQVLDKLDEKKPAKKAADKAE